MYSKLAHWLRTFQANVSSPSSTLFNIFDNIFKLTYLSSVWLRTFQANVSSPNCTLFNIFQRVPHTLRDFARTHIYSNFLFSKELFSGEKKPLTSYFGIYGHSYLIFPPFHSIKHHVLPREVSHAFSLFHPYQGHSPRLAPYSYWRDYKGPGRHCWLPPNILPSFFSNRTLTFQLDT